MSNKAIVTKYLGPTNSRGSRIKATVYGASLTRGYNCALSSELNHYNVAVELFKKMNPHSLAWLLISAHMPDGKSMVFVEAMV